MRELPPYEDDTSPDDNPSLTRRALCAKAEDLAVELVRWKVWRVEGLAREQVKEAQALQALLMGLIELLDDVQGSATAARTALERAIALLGYAWPPQDAPATPASQRSQEERREDAAFLRQHGLRFDDDTGAETATS